MIRVQLPPTEAQRLDRLFRTTADRKLRDRLQIVLLAHRGRARQDIAADLSVHRRTVSRWLNAYCDGGLDGLQPRTPPGKPPAIPAAPFTIRPPSTTPPPSPVPTIAETDECRDASAPKQAWWA